MAWMSIDELWRWIERLSWVAVVIGIPTAAWQLSKRPRLVVGFFPRKRTGWFRRRAALSPQATVQKTQKQAAQLAAIEFVVMNDGRASARDLLINFSFPSSFGKGQIGSGGEGRFILDSPSGRLVWTLKEEYVHPGDRILCQCEFAIAGQVSEVDVLYEISLADASTCRGSLMIKLAGPETKGPPQ